MSNLIFIENFVQEIERINSICSSILIKATDEVRDIMNSKTCGRKLNPDQSFSFNEVLTH